MAGSLRPGSPCPAVGSVDGGAERVDGLLTQQGDSLPSLALNVGKVMRGVTVVPTSVLESARKLRSGSSRVEHTLVLTGELSCSSV